ncbi:osmosensitive K+ channel histidine kinase KdpD [Geomicrobium sp. JCM 19037]|uniref:universal stress protein n=1 Tax=Geomicrobium sp. JCM 19037 TaxID=1460634 RepID=UPI00045F3FB1|nr:universal stress protein [Geomicrobium sp. JCM 19037]GAK05505.1 osmosensitive K+ channel histidine kinase KdpD [Geomicrobium sp. JCM 19037]
MAERILVCVNYGHHGTRLIERGAELARTSDARLYILIFDSLPEDDYKNDKLVDMSIFQELAEQCEAQLIIENSQAHNITRVIKKTAEDVEATQVVIGQQVENLWTTLLGGSIIDVLLHELPSADLHVVPKPRADAEADWNFERGVNATSSSNPTILTY